MARNEDINKSVRCSFCGKRQEEVDRIIAGPGVYICNECIGLCNSILAEEEMDEQISLEEEIPESIITPAEI